MSWSVELTKPVERALREMDPQSSRRLRRALAAIETIDDRRTRGKALAGPLAGLWRYRVGDYRIVCDVIDDRLIALVIDIDHRSNTYDR